MELLKDMSTPTMINALVRFQSRRLGLKVLYSDNGTNFKGADNELKKAVSSWNNAKLISELQLRGVEWRFGPPHTPHVGGIWECLVQSAKKHIYALLSSEALDVDTFATVLVEVEGVLNRQPLTYQSTDIHDPGVLTPSDFLYPGMFSHSSIRVLPPLPPGDGEVLCYSWRKAHHLIDEFWKRWSRKYVALLQSRAKWRRTVPDL